MENVIERAVILSPGDFIVPESLPPNLHEAGGDLGGALRQPHAWTRPWPWSEKQILLETLKSLDWNRQLTARTLGISRTTLFNKMRRFELKDPRRRAREPRRTHLRPGPLGRPRQNMGRSSFPASFCI